MKIIKSFFNLFKKSNVEDIEFSASFQRVPATQVSVQTDDFLLLSGINAQETLVELDGYVNTLLGAPVIPTFIDAGEGLSATENSLNNWSIAVTGDYALNSYVDYVSGALDDLVIPNYDSEITYLSGAISSIEMPDISLIQSTSGSWDTAWSTVSSWSTTGNISAEKFNFENGGYLTSTGDGKNLLYVNISGASAQITNFS